MFCPALALVVMTTSLDAAAASGTKATADSSTSLLFGINMHPARYDQTLSSQIASQFKLAAGTASNTVRVDVDWSALQPSSGETYDYGYVQRLNEVFSNAQKNDLKVIVTFLSTPCWASADPNGTAGCSGSDDAEYPPSDDAAYAQAAGWLVARYAQSLAAFEVWNEPDFQGDSSDFVSSNPAADYTNLLKATYPVVKKADPTLPVLAGALMNVDTSFLQQLLADGAAGSFDGLSLHMYNLDEGSGTWTKAKARDTYDFKRLPQLHQMLTSNGLKTPIWVTELGYFTCGSAEDTNCTTPSNAAIGIRGIVPALASLSYVQDLEVYELVDDAGVASTDSSWGLYARNGAARPLAETVTDVFKTLPPPSEPDKASK